MSPNRRQASRVDKLRNEAAAASELRSLSEHPDVIALQVERVRSFVDTVIWVGIGLGLAFTMTNVQAFAAAGALPWSLTWLAAWLLDPMVSLILVAVLRAEQITARYQIDIGIWGRRTKIFTFVATYIMNTWSSWAELHLPGIVLHSVPPILVYCAAETAPMVRDRLTTAVMAAATAAKDSPLTPAGELTGEKVESPSVETVMTPMSLEDTRPVARPARKRAAITATKSRTSFGDYLATALAAYTPGIDPTPAWVRQVTSCSRGLSSRIAAAVREHAETAETATVHSSSVNTTRELKEVA